MEKPTKPMQTEKNLLIRNSRYSSYGIVNPKKLYELNLVGGSIKKICL